MAITMSSGEALPTPKREPHIIVAGPSKLLQSDEAETSLAGARRLTGNGANQKFLLLPHPRTSTPAYFLPSSSGDEIYELQALRGERKNRSWFLDGRQDTTPEQGADRGWVIRDGTMHILSPIDPFFLVLALLNLSNSTFVPLEDLFDSAAASFYASRSERYNSLIPKNSTEIPVAEDGNGGASTWTDIIEFGKLKTTRGALERCCDVQALDAAQTSLAYRPSLAKIKQSLSRKIETLSSKKCFEDHASVLERTLAKQTEIDATEAQLATARRRIAADLIRNYVPISQKGGETLSLSMDDVLDGLLS